MINPLDSIIGYLASAPSLDVKELREAHLHPAVHSFRINSRKINDSPFENASPVPWCSDGFYLRARPSYVLHPFWHGGAIYVQEASSMFLQEVMKQVLNLKNELLVLDACAAPGGKSTLIASLLNNESVLISNEVIQSRMNVLQENLIKWGHSNAIVTRSDSQQFSALKGVFDCVVVDAPCSGSGLFRKDPASMAEWSLNNVGLCSERQRRILGNLVPSLKDEGILIYSTCSYSVEENEMIVNYLCSEHNLDTIDLEIPNDWNIVNSQSGCYRFYPYLLSGEGFFIAAFRKKSKGDKQKSQLTDALKTMKADDSFTQFLNGEYRYFNHKENLFAVSVAVLKLTGILRQAKINIVRAGIDIGQQKGIKFVPSHALAMNEILNPSIESIELNEEEALKYLRKETISPVSDMGFKTVNYKGVNLGWINILQDRSNNMYPTNWRLMR